MVSLCAESVIEPETVIEEIWAWPGKTRVEFEARMMVGRVTGVGAQVRQRRKVDRVSGLGSEGLGCGGVGEWLVVPEGPQADATGGRGMGYRVGGVGYEGEGLGSRVLGVSGDLGLGSRVLGLGFELGQGEGCAFAAWGRESNNASAGREVKIFMGAPA